MKFNFVILILGLYTSLSYSQVKSRFDTIPSIYYKCIKINDSDGYFNDLRLALMYPLKVKILDLRSYGLDSIPKEVYLFENLEVLDLSTNYILDYIKEYKPNPHYSTILLEDSILENITWIHRKIIKFRFGTFGRNNISYIPDDLFKLKNLKSVIFSSNKLIYKEIKRIHKKYPKILPIKFHIDD